MPIAAPELFTAHQLFCNEIREFRWNGRRSAQLETLGVPTFVNEFWTSRQRQANTLHEVSYRACFKPQLPAFFIDRLTRAGDRVYDPFAGRGTTPLEAAFAGRVPLANDVNPLTATLLAPRLDPPTQDAVLERLDALDLSEAPPVEGEDDLLAFFHPETLIQIACLREYLLEREANGHMDAVDRWIRMVALGRLTGHSPGFFSVYTLPPNQAVTASAQRTINARRDQVPPAREIKKRVARKSKALLRDVDAATRARLANVRAELLTRPAHDTPEIPTGSVDLVVTSPPFLDVVNYAADNWLRCWFAGIDPASVALTASRGLEGWKDAMTDVFHELFRVVRPGGSVAFEVGEVRGGKVCLEETAIPCALAAGFVPLLVMINDQKFTKTANCWGVSNQVKGTNTNRIPVFVRP